MRAKLVRPPARRDCFHDDAQVRRGGTHCASTVFGWVPDFRTPSENRTRKESRVQCRNGGVTAVSGAPAKGEEPALRGGSVPPVVEVHAIDGPFFFGAAEKVRETEGQVKVTPRVWIILMRRVSAIDSTGIRMLRTLVRGAHRDGARVILAGVHAQPMLTLGRAELLDEIGEAGLCGTLDEALNAARAHLGLSPAPRPVARGGRQ